MVHPQPSRLDDVRLDAAAGGHYLAQLAIGFLGVLIVTGEYATGMIRSSFLAVPRRLPVPWAKLAVFATVVFELMLIASVIAFFITQAIVSVHQVDTSITTPHAMRVLVATALVITLVGMLSIAFGALTRSTVVGAALLVFFMFVLSGLAALLPNYVADDVNPYPPINTAYTAATSTFDPGPHLSPWGASGSSSPSSWSRSRSALHVSDAATPDTAGRAFCLVADPAHDRIEA
jgi:ABC-2 type transport system permease protein